ncbi:Meprin A subunit beta [Homalodisca vitripennis]|nr:Meprin A subunit beta [Homalodisca vitripennis]
MTLNLPYDYGSVMHYRSVAFSRDFRSPTIIPRVPSAARLMGQRIRFSQLDIAKLNRLYKCSRRYYHGDDAITKSDIGHVDEDVEEEAFDFNIEEMGKAEINSTETNGQNPSP